MRNKKGPSGDHEWSWMEIKEGDNKIDSQAKKRGISDQQYLSSLLSFCEPHVYKIYNKNKNKILCSKYRPDIKNIVFSRKSINDIK